MVDWRPSSLQCRLGQAGLDLATYSVLMSLVHSSWFVALHGSTEGHNNWADIWGMDRTTGEWSCSSVDLQDLLKMIYWRTWSLTWDLSTAYVRVTQCCHWLRTHMLYWMGKYANSIGCIVHLPFAMGGCCLFVIIYIRVELKCLTVFCEV